MSTRASVALTVDVEGSAPSATEGVATLLDLFDTHRARATFFFLGELALEAPDLVRTTAQRGHEIGFHGHRHVMLNTLSEASLRNEPRDLEAKAGAAERDSCVRLSRTVLFVDA